MKNSLGNPARGDAFYPRGGVINKIYKVLKTGVSIYLAAPRRVGKTSILKYLEEKPEEGFFFIYIITESVDDENEFYKIIFEELLKTNAIKGLAKVSEAAKSFLGKIADRVESVQGVKIKEGKTADYFSLLKELLSHISKDYVRIVIMIDEFPETIQNIHEKNDTAAAKHFLQSNRELRHDKNLQDKVNFIYTGSVSLEPMVEKVTSLTAINDLSRIDVAPFSREEAHELLVLLLSNDKLELDNKLINKILDRINWLVPFHIQLIQQEIVDVYETTRKTIDEEAIDTAFEQMVHSRNKRQFEPYFSRLKSIFKNENYEFVMDLLKQIAIKDEVGKDVVNDLAVKNKVKDVRNIMDILEGDGYIFKADEKYRYTSPILQLWCKKHICQ